jgi:hypothetical protein
LLHNTWKAQTEFNWFSGKPETRIIQWRRFRKWLDTCPDPVLQVAQAWAACPISGHMLEPDDHRHWPDAWTLIGQGDYCEVGRGLGMFYTLVYSSYRHRDVLVLEYYHDTKNHQTLNLVNCEAGKYMLNYSLGMAVNRAAIDPSALLIRTTTSRDLERDKGQS